MSFFKNQTFVAVDLETTGVEAEKDRIIEFAGVLVENGKVVKQLEFVVNPGIEISPQVQAITGITNEEVAGKPSWEEVKEEVQAFVKDAMIVGHNVQFDIRFLEQNGVQTSPDSLDTYVLSSLFFTEEKSLALEVLSERFEIEHKYKHRALGDILATVELLKIIHKKMRELPPVVLEKAREYLADKEHALKTLFENVETEPTLVEKVQMSLFQSGGEEVTVTPLPEADEQLQEILSLEGKTVLEKPHQFKSVLETVADLQGKRRESVVSFYSPRLFNKVLQSMSESGISDYAVVKNASNYLCKRKFERFLEKKNPTEAELNLALKLVLWREQTRTGDRDELALTYEDYPLWYRELCSNDSCSGREHADCYWHESQQEAKKAKLVLTYQNLLLDSGVPAREKLVVPEARDLEKSMADLGAKKIELGAFTDVLNALKEAGELQAQRSQLKSSVDNLELFWGYLYRELTQNLSDFVYPQKVAFTQQLKARPGFLELKGSLHDLLVKIEEVLNFVDNFTKFKYQTNQLKNLLRDLQDFFEEQHENEVRYFIAFPSGDLVLHVGVIEMKPYTTQILEKYANVLCLDENLATVNGDNEYTFEYWKKSLGWEDALWEERWMEKGEEQQGTVDLSFLHTKPTAQNVLERTCDLIKEKVLENKGKTLVLFSSYASIQAHFEVLALDLQKLGYKVLAQGQGGGTKKIKAIFEQFPEKSVIFGIERSYHRDFFAVKDLKTVILHKLVFDFPNDPLIQARQAHFGNAFMDFSLPRSMLSFKQTYLKLQSKEQVFIPLDSRLTEKRYGGYFLEALKRV